MASKTRSLYENSRREATIILALWLVSSLYSGTYCYLFGYKEHAVVSAQYGSTVSEAIGPLEDWNRSRETLTFPASIGIPDWTFYGVVLPWAICIVLTILFCIFIFAEDDLTDGAGSEEPNRE